jgi:hypothetical protein
MRFCVAKKSLLKLTAIAEYRKNSCLNCVAKQLNYTSILFKKSFIELVCAWVNQSRPNVIKYFTLVIYKCS